ncbi:MAG: glycosyltransferase family 2 protein [Duncaniella sp.]|uniref:glycosyltransferase family 2 protein n=1 Tax=Duncaniella sp. TaxID=2518496 RepID=UPI0023C51E0D|nr:glycosyltransferase family 2 protein [Duncaniella sp.]MDE5987920.1 glycosyltransferase family 2 protein [Duncaniella sp.]
MADPKTIAIVVPCFNEEAVLPITIPKLISVLDRMEGLAMVSPESYILCCDDGSKDATWEIIRKFHLGDKRVKGISLAHNRGHQYALLAGLMTAKDRCDAAVSIDADLQDDPEAIIEMVRRFISGKEIVYGVRTDRDSDSWFKRSTAHAFYSLQRKMGIEAIYDHADFRLMSRQALDLLSEYGESNLFLRGIIPQLGLESDIVTYSRASRIAGESKYPIAKMLSFSIDGITSFSAKPMRWVFYIGLAFLAIDVLIGIYVGFSILYSDRLEAGWASILLSVWFLGSLILMAIGLTGEYIGKIFIEVKQRPRYAIRDVLFD